MPRLTRMGFTVRFHLAGSQPEDYGDDDGFEFREATLSGRSTLVPSAVQPSTEPRLHSGGMSPVV
jgi:hypothetical protein